MLAIVLMLASLGAVLISSKEDTRYCLSKVRRSMERCPLSHHGNNEQVSGSSPLVGTSFVFGLDKPQYAANAAPMRIRTVISNRAREMRGTSLCAMLYP